MTATWEDYLTEDDRAVIERGKWAQSIGFGDRPALIIIDAQYYMTGEDPDDTRFPLSCGATAWKAVGHIRRILDTARDTAVPVFYTRFIIDPSVDDAGVFHRKIGVARSEFTYIKDTRGSQIVEEIAPRPGEIVIDKKKSSAFFGTPLLAYLTDRGVDTLIVTGGATCNCVRATVYDSASYNLNTIIPAEAVFDRIPISHQISLFDMNRFLGDVVGTNDVIAGLERAGTGSSRIRTAGS